MTRILGIVNITADSFSDGGQFLEPRAAIEHANALMAAGAHAVDLGPASTHPDAESVAPQEEIRRLGPVVDALDVPISIDSYHAETQRWALARGVAFLNDIQGFPHVDLHAELADSDTTLIAMFSIQATGGATRQDSDPDTLLQRIHHFFDARVDELMTAGVRRDRLILDPGMGFFLGTDPTCSLAVIQSIPSLRDRYDLPILVSVSRKSFLRALTGTPLDHIGAATLSAELTAARNGAAWIRTHDVRALQDGLTVQLAL
jgi:dihydropteroate synthase type 2